MKTLVVLGVLSLQAAGLTAAMRDQIVLPEQASAVERTAANELKEALVRITGEAYSVVGEDQAVAARAAYAVGATRFAAKLAAASGWKDPEPDEIRRGTVDGCVVLDGHPQRGAIYSVDSFLEDVAGVRWWNSGESDYPKRPNWRPDALSAYRYAPPFRFRETFYRSTLMDADFKVGGDIAAERFEPAGTVSVSNANVRGGTDLTKITCGRMVVGGVVDAKKDLKVGQTVFARNVSFGGDLWVGGAARAERVTVRSTDFTVNGKPPLSCIGMIVMWAGSPNDVPPGWEICDGRVVKVNGGSMRMPDFTGRFVMGTTSNKGVGTTGGVRTVALKAEELPKHVHKFTFGSHGYAGASADGGKYMLRTEGKNLWDKDGYDTDPDEKKVGKPGAAHENLPPYWALYYIMKVR